MAPILADGASVAFAKSEEDMQSARRQNGRDLGRQPTARSLVPELRPFCPASRGKPQHRAPASVGRPGRSQAATQVSPRGGVQFTPLISTQRNARRDSWRNSPSLPAQVFPETRKHQDFAVADPPRPGLADDRLDRLRRVLFEDEKR